MAPAFPAVTAAEAAATKILLETPAVTETAPGPVRFGLEARKFSLSLLNATLAYTVELTNTGTEALQDLALYGDMMGGNAATPHENLIQGPAAEAAPLHRIDTLAPGETRALRGEFRVPFPAITPIRQGNTAATLPLARFRLNGPAGELALRVFAVGEASKIANGDAETALTPFRLDQGPRIFNQLALRRFA